MSEPAGDAVAPAAPAMSEQEQGLLRALRTHKLACPHCTYDLRHATSLRCPECGRTVEATAFRIGRVFPKSRLLVGSIVGSCVWMIYGPIGVLALRSAYDTPPRLVSNTLALAMFVVGAWLAWSMAYRPLRWLERSPSVKAAMWACLVVPGGLLVLAMLVGAVWVLVTVARVWI